MPRVRLAYITTVPGTQFSFLRGQNEYLKGQGFELFAISSPGPRLTQLAERDGVQCFAVPISRRVAVLSDLLALFRLTLLVRRIRPDILHVSTPKAALLGAIAGWLCRIQVRVFLVRGSITQGERGVRRRIYRFLEGVTVKMCHQVISVSPSLLTFLRQERILPEEKGVVVRYGGSNGIDPDRFDPKPYCSGRLSSALPQEVPWVGFAGRLVRDKGIEDIAAAWAVLRERFTDLHLLLLGEWQKVDPVDAEIRAMLETDPRVLLPGRVDNIVPYLAGLSVFLFPTHREGLPNALIEACAMELPTVASEVIGCTDVVVDGSTGTLVPARNPAELQAAVERYLRDPDLRRAHGSAARQRVISRYRQEDLWEAYCTEYLRLMRTNKNS